MIKYSSLFKQYQVILGWDTPYFSILTLYQFQATHASKVKRYYRIYPCIYDANPTGHLNKAENFQKKGFVLNRKMIYIVRYKISNKKTKS